MFFAKSNGFISFGDVISWHHTPVILFFFCACGFEILLRSKEKFERNCSGQKLPN